MATPYQMNFASARRQGQARAAAPAPAPAPIAATPTPGPAPAPPAYTGGTRNYQPSGTPAADPFATLAAQQQKFNQRGVPAPSRANLLPAQQPGFMQRMYGGMRGNPGSVPLPPMYAGPKPPGAPMQRMPVYGGSQPPMGPGMPPPQMAPQRGMGGLQGQNQAALAAWRQRMGGGLQGGQMLPAVTPQNPWGQPTREDLASGNPQAGFANAAHAIYGNPDLTAQEQQAAFQQLQAAYQGGQRPAVMPQRPGNPGIAGVVSRLGGRGGYPVAAPPRSSIGGQPDTRALAPARYF